MTINITTSQGPSANNQTSEIHDQDTNQKARHPDAPQTLRSEGIDEETLPNVEFVAPDKK